MAAKGSFAISSSWREGGPNGKDILALHGILTVNGGGGGALTTDFPVSIFSGMRKLHSCTPLVISTNDAIETASPITDGTALVTKSGTTHSLADIAAGTYTCVVRGRT